MTRHLSDLVVGVGLDSRLRGNDKSAFLAKL